MKYPSLSYRSRLLHSRSDGHDFCALQVFCLRIAYSIPCVCRS